MQELGFTDGPICSSVPAKTGRILLGDRHQLVLPTSTEQVITAQGLVNLHLGLGLSRPQRTVESVADALARVVSNPVFRRRALDVAVGVRARREPGALDVLTERCGALLA